MSRKGFSPDNAACEGFFARLKTLLFYPRNWRSTTVDEFVAALDSYIGWYNDADEDLAGFLQPHRVS